MKLILASNSPRRRELLTQAGFTFTVVPADIDETPRPGELPAAFAERMAAEKAHTVARLTTDRDAVILAADTIVLLGDRILGKPADADEARRMLKDLSGKSHEVLTGFACLRLPDGALRQRVEITSVTFRPLAESEIDTYIHSGEPFDKAGAYAIQGGGWRLCDRGSGRIQQRCRLAHRGGDAAAPAHAVREMTPFGSTSV